jgi:ketosteroid isomerase-like protein
MTNDQIETSVPHTTAQRAVAEHLRLLTSGELKAWGELFTADAIFTFPFAPAGMSAELHGSAALQAHMQNFVGTFDVRAVNLQFIETASPDITVAKWTLDGTAKPTGKLFRQDCVGVVRTDGDGRITRYDDYWNPLAAIDALQPAGVEPSNGSSIADSFGT